ncbi:TIGR00730 family Rossman fold protein [Acidicapsa dinghuensis]|uniref:Cytokinin riboside 5'-monophosphate phosphoribohydrolase n=1 Tax=Acidicapsa dinghuensis TaxID=2218256 RepID=A0ABW1EHX8_9BACT|nr:TIGR00730 family Rossman fold protein [Acidicapsa dinghuensis]
MLKRVCVFCGSNSGSGDAYLKAARETGRLLAESGIELVYGGGKVGLMGAIADACLEAGGSVIGVIPHVLVLKEVAHRGLTELHIVQTMLERKTMMADMSDAFIALPGGYGTLDELSEVLTWSQIGIQHKPSGLLNVNGYYDHLLAMMDRAVKDRFLSEVHRELLLTETDPRRLLKYLEKYTPPQVDKWMDRVDR